VTLLFAGIGYFLQDRLIWQGVLLGVQTSCLYFVLYRLGRIHKEVVANTLRGHPFDVPKE
jgi:hypothetical protein